LIGYLGLILPALLWLIAGWRTMEGLQPWKPLASVSAYYYTGAVSAFAGILVALALFLFSYRGYDNAYHRRDRIAAIIAGVAAVLVAFFPTGAPGDLKALSWWTPLIGGIHYFSAVVLFGAFIFFSIFLFRRSKVKRGESLPRGKRFRNVIHIFCGVAMLACMLWAGIATVTGATIFWPEAFALEFFAVSWLTKGRADITVVAAGKRTLYYGRHHRQLFAEFRRRTTA
ncbi:hypothetical protein ACFLVN_05225, partial [Chloroflexota bacterium]